MNETPPQRSLTAGGGDRLAVCDDHWHWPRGPGTKRINLALQGGGAHGAFAWGVLDRLLEDGRIEIEAISGTSAGAMNAVVAAEGLMKGGPEHARMRLEEFWRRISVEALSSPVRRSFLDMLFTRWSLDHNPALTFFDMVTRVVSPYQFNPFNINPLRDLLASEVDFATVGACDCFRLFISATNVLTGRVKVFTGPEVTADAVMASACLPYIFHAVEIDGTPYWDGGYMGNPVLYPFFSCQSQDVLLVQTNPIHRDTAPKTAREILDRVHEISFNAALIKELAYVEFVNRSLGRGLLAETGFRELYLHAVSDCQELEHLSPSSKLNAEWSFLTHLRDVGRAAAGSWLERSFERIGGGSTMDLSPFRDEPAGIEPAARVAAPVPDGM
jgi:NTE family protein